MTAYILQPHHVKKPIYAQIKDEHRRNTTYDIKMGDQFIISAKRIGEAKAFLSGVWWAITGEKLIFPPRRKQLSILPRRDKCVVSNSTMARRALFVSYTHVRGSTITLYDQTDPTRLKLLWTSTRRAHAEIELYAQGVLFAYHGPLTMIRVQPTQTIKDEVIISPGLTGPSATQIIQDELP